MKFKDETMKQNFEKCEKRIKEIAAGDALIEKWSAIHQKKLEEKMEKGEE